MRQDLVLCKPVDYVNILMITEPILLLLLFFSFSGKFENIIKMSAVRLFSRKMGWRKLCCEILINHL